ncbi:MFS general substrate transporter [Gymnopilus junonius]|uniref:MFS general substrate transporter n=1 Tax=Gymnopilus junonius TaxID=109634 RepID=A0A9P5TUQ6_GYMJU|nr:MFS general substrate transporter [Gymnopilus junonius]
MTTSVQESKVEISEIEKNSHTGSVDEKFSLDLQDGDEALRLIGVERTAQFSEEYNEKLKKKLDWLIPPLCAAVYFTQFLDKTSLNYASIMGLPITGQRYNLVSLSFYLGFLVWEFPTVYISQKTRVAKYLGANIVLWGIVLMLHAVGTSFGAFFALRFLLGMCESCVAPSLILIISMFYKKNEQAKRISWFYVMNGITQIFGGFVAYGISFDDGKQLAPYKIIYVLLGGLAILVGICVLIWLPDSPVHAHFLTKEERIAALERVRDDGGGTENKHLKKYQVIETFMDVRTWLIVLTTLVTSIPNGALSNFSNLIIKGFGYTSKQTLILSTPGGAVAALMTLACGWYSDKKGERMLPIIFALVPTIVGSAMLIGLNDSGQKGALLFGKHLKLLPTCSVYLIGTFGSALASVYAYNASNTSGHTKKSTINAMTLVSFSVGNIIGTEIFQPKDAPAYIPGKIAIMVLLTVQLAISMLLRWINIRLNVKKQEVIAELKAQRGWTDADIQRERERHAFADLTDKENIYFVYTA